MILTAIGSTTQCLNESRLRDPGPTRDAMDVPTVLFSFQSAVVNLASSGVIAEANPHPKIAKFPIEEALILPDFQ